MSTDNQTYVRRIRVNESVWLGVNQNGMIYILDMDSSHGLRIIDAMELVENNKKALGAMIEALTQLMSSTQY